MKRKQGWFPIGPELVLFLLLLMVLPACSRPFIEVTVGAQCRPDGIEDPTGPQPTKCRYDGGKCTYKPAGCKC